MKRRYIRQGKCIQCGWCCLKEDPPCEYLEYDIENGKYICTVFDEPEKRHVRCGMYPDAPPILHEGCGYSFYDTWEDKIVKRKL